MMKDSVNGKNSSRTGSRLKDVAEALNLSISTVSAALKDRLDISESTRRRVARKAKELGYRPNWLARSLALNRTHVLGIVIPDLSRSFFPQILKGIDSVARSAGYHLLVCSTDDDPVREDDEIATLLGKQVDGLIVASAHMPPSNGCWQSVKKMGVPLVLVDRAFPSVPSVAADNERIGYIATEHLINKGYRNIAHLGRCSVMTGVGRRRGYISALRNFGYRVRRNYILEVQGEIGGYEGAKRLLQLSPRPDAIFAVSDPIAIGALQALEEAGLRVPDDCGIIGVGRAAYGEYLRIPLSTVDQHPFETGKAATSILLGIIAGQPPSSRPVLLTPTLVVRGSSSRSAANQDDGRGDATRPGC
jgi:LacI family transcriptional regulator